jgi:hypothetical protein
VRQWRGKRESNPRPAADRREALPTHAGGRQTLSSSADLVCDRSSWTLWSAVRRKESDHKEHALDHGQQITAAFGAGKPRRRRWVSKHQLSALACSCGPADTAGLPTVPACRRRRQVPCHRPVQCFFCQARLQHVTQTGWRTHPWLTPALRRLLRGRVCRVIVGTSIARWRGLFARICLGRTRTGSHARVAAPWRHL